MTKQEIIDSRPPLSDGWFWADVDFPESNTWVLLYYEILTNPHFIVGRVVDMEDNCIGYIDTRHNIVDDVICWRLLESPYKG